MLSKRLSAFALACAGLILSGCAGLNSGGSSDLLKQLDANFATCDRHITFQAGVGITVPGAQVSGSVDCKGNAAPIPPAAS
ncbi:MAG: hypothetical protein ACXWKO_02545 [Phenylobacterium sp.]